MQTASKLSLADRPAEPVASSWQLSASSASIALHVAAIVLCVVAMGRHQPIPKPPAIATMDMVFEAPPQPMAMQSFAERRTQQAASPTQTADLATPSPVSLPATRRAISHVVRAPRREGPTPQPSAPDALPAERAPITPSASPAPPAAPHQQNAIAMLEGQIRQAVQDAAIYPPAARLMHREGRAQIRFDYTDGAVGRVGLAASSENSVLDEAALSAVRRAHLPHAPAAIGERTLALLVWVNFAVTVDN
jgi:protein TonB